MMLTVTKNVNITQEDIDEIMCTALEGGISYWCMYAQSIMPDEWMKENSIVYLSDITGRGGDIVLTTVDGDYVLTLKAFLTGVQMAIDDDTIAIETINNEYRIDTCMIDADIADVIIQYALFGKLVYA